MQAVVLAGGRGQRLHPLTARTPKPLVPVLGRPLLGHLLLHLHSRGVEEAFVTAGYMGAAIAEFVRSARLPLRVQVVQEGSVRGTAGAVADLLPELRTPFLVVSGDSVLDLDLNALVAAHRAALADATICAAPPAGRLRFGVIAAHGGRVDGFVEKPGLDELLPGLVVSTGCYLLERAALAESPAHGPVDFAQDVFPRLLHRGARLAVAPGLRYWRDIGTAEAYRDIHLEAISGQWPWSAAPPGAPARLGAGAEVVGPAVFGQGVTIGPRARLLGPVYVGDGASVGAGATVARSVLLGGSRVGAHAEVVDAVLDAAVASGAAVSGAIVGRTDWLPPRHVGRSATAPVGRLAAVPDRAPSRAPAHA